MSDFWTRYEREMAKKENLLDLGQEERTICPIHGKKRVPVTDYKKGRHPWQIRCGVCVRLNKLEGECR